MRRDVDAWLSRWLAEGQGPAAVTGVRGCGKTTAVRGLLDRAGVRYAYLDYDADGLYSSLSSGNAKRVMAEVEESSGDGDPEVVVIDGVNGSARMARSAAAILGLSRERRVIAVGDVAGGFGEGFEEAHMSPLTFAEYLDASGADCDERGLQELFFEFVAVGGFPAAVSSWLETGSDREADRAERELVARMRDDAIIESGSPPEVVSGIMDSIPEQLGRRNKKFMYNRAVAGARAKGLAAPLGAMERLGVVLRVPIRGSPTAGFKAYCCDTGLLRVLGGLPASQFRVRDGDELVKGMVENAVLLELVKSGYDDVSCWRSGNRAEAELVVHGEGGDVPIQVDLSDAQYARSLKEYSARHPGCRTVYMSPSPGEGTWENLRVPLYRAGELRRILSEPQDNN